MNIIEINQNDEEFPIELRMIQDSPKKLYCIGNINLLKNKKIAVVGSRKCTAYGKSIAERLSTKLSNSGVSVVSGLARGIDSCAHNGALKEVGSTISVLATGIDRCYPALNQGIYNEISKNGLIISENPPGYICHRYDFPRRNRIISGLSDAVVVVEAPLRSGALITAEYAMEQGKELFAIPGNITSFFSIGCNQLIREGAKPVAVLDDVLTDLNIEVHNNEENLNLGDDEFAVYDIIRKRGELSTEDLMKFTDFEVPKLAGILTVLEMKGAITNSMGKFFVEFSKK